MVFPGILPWAPQEGLDYFILMAEPFWEVIWLASSQVYLLNIFLLSIS